MPYLGNGGGPGSQPGPPQIPPRKRPPITKPPTGSSSLQIAQLAAVDDMTQPKVASVFVEDRLPAKSGFKCFAGFPPCYVAGTAGKPGPFVANSSNSGGTWVVVDTNLMTVNQILNGVSTVSATSPNLLISTHVHTGATDSAGNPMPENIDLTQLKGGSYPAPTFTGGTTPTTQDELSGVTSDVTFSVTVNNVPQDGSVYGVVWYVRNHGSTNWGAWSETALTGLPTPAASQAIVGVLKGVTNGVSYDFGVAYVTVRGDVGAIATLVSSFQPGFIGIVGQNLICNGGAEAGTARGTGNVNPPSLLNLYPGWLETQQAGETDTFSIVTGTNGGGSSQYDVEKADPYAGQISRPSTSHAGAALGCFLQQRIQVQPNAFYSFRGWWQLTNVINSQIQVTYYQSNGTATIGSGTVIGSPSNLVAATTQSGTGSWALVSNTVQAPSNAGWMDISIIAGYSNNGTTAGVTSFDNLMLVNGKTPMAFAPMLVPPQVANNYADVTGSIIATMFGGAFSVVPNGQTYAGWDRFTPASTWVYDSNYSVLPANGWLWTSWYGVQTTTADTWAFGFMSSAGGTAHYEFLLAASGNYNLKQGGSTLVVTSGLSVNANDGNPHRVTIGIQYLSSTSARLVLYVDNIKVIDFTHTGATGLTSQWVPGIWAQNANEVYIRDWFLPHVGTITSATPMLNQGSIPPQTGNIVVTSTGTYPNAGVPTITVDVSTGSIAFSDGSTITLTAVSGHTYSAEFVETTASGGGGIVAGTTYFFSVWYDMLLGTINISALTTNGDYTTGIGPISDGRSVLVANQSCSTPSTQGSGSHGGSGGGGKDTCPAATQVLTRLRKKKFLWFTWDDIRKVRADELRVGDYLKDPYYGWNRINELVKRKSWIYRVFIADDYQDVDRCHKYLTRDMGWLPVTVLRPGDLLLATDDSEVPVEWVGYDRYDYFMQINCTNHRFVVESGKTKVIGHNYTTL